MNEQFKPEMDEEKMGVLGIESAGECDSIMGLDESSVIVGGEREETSSLEDKPVAVGGGAEDGRQNHVSGREPEFVGEGAAEMVERPAVVAVDGGSEVSASEGGDLPLVMEEDRAELVDYAEREAVVAEGGTALVSDESPVNKEGDEPVIDSELKMDMEEEIEPAVDAMLKKDVTDSEMQMDARRHEMFVDTQLEMKSEGEVRPLGDSKKEVVDTDAGYEQQLSEFPTETAGDGLNLVMEGTEALNDKHDERELGDEESVGALGGVENESVERLTVENNTETAERCDEVAEDKSDLMVNDLEVERAENSNVVQEEKGDPGIIADLPITEVETDGSVHLDNVCEQEQVHESSDGMEDGSGHESNERGEDKVLAPEERPIHGTKMVDDGNLSMEVSSDAKLDNQLSDAEYNEDVLVEADLPVGDIKPEEESRVESEMTRNAEVEQPSEDAEVETEMGTNSIDSKTTEDDGKLETEDTMSDVDEPGHDMYDSSGALQDEEDETIVAEEETGAQDTEMETETDMAESEKTSGGKRKRAKLSKSPSLTKAAGKTSRKTVGEDVCFICFDGGELVLCDRR